MTQKINGDPLFDPEVVQDPYDYYRQLRESDPVHEVVGTGTYLVTRAETIYDVIARPETFSSESSGFLHEGGAGGPVLSSGRSGYTGEGGGGLATVDPPDHGRQRRVVTQKLSTTNMRAMEPEFRALVEGAMADIPADGAFEWMSKLAEPLPMVMVARILGLPDALAPELKKQGYAMVEGLSGFVLDERLTELENEQLDGLAAVTEAYTREGGRSARLGHDDRPHGPGGWGR